MLDFLQRLHKEGNTIVLITHDNSIAAEAQRIIRLADGRIVYDGPSVPADQVQYAEGVHPMQPPARRYAEGVG